MAHMVMASVSDLLKKAGAATGFVLAMSDGTVSHTGADEFEPLCDQRPSEQPLYARAVDRRIADRRPGESRLHLNRSQSRFYREVVFVGKQPSGDVPVNDQKVLLLALGHELIHGETLLD